MEKHKKITEKTDLELIQIYKTKSNNDILGILFKRYTEFVFLLSMKYLKEENAAKDAVMQIFEKLFSDLKKHEIKNFKSWLHSVTRNHCLLTLRSRSYSQKKELEFKKDTIEFVESDNFIHQLNENNDEEKYQKLKLAIEELNDEQKLCIDLFYLKGKSYKEVAEFTGYDIKKVKSCIQNGKRNLKNFLVQSGGFSIILLLFM